MATNTDDSAATIIGDSMQVRGNLSGDEDLHVLGRVEGSVELTKTLLVAESGVVKAEVSVKNAIISGVVVGNVHATEAVEIMREGRMVGDISSPRVIIVDGASFRGNVDMGDVENMPARPPRTERPKPIVSRPSAAPVRGDDADDAVEDEITQVVKTPPRGAKPAPAAKTTITARGDGKGAGKTGGKAAGKGKPKFLDPPKARGLPKKSKKKRSRVVVKRK